MFLDFLTVFHTIRKNQESWNSWLGEFWVRALSKVPKISVNKFFLRFWAAIMDLLITLKYYILFFLISYLQEYF